MSPDLFFLDNERPTKEMKYFFQEHMEFEHMVDQVLTAWMMLAERKAEEVEEGSGERWLGVIRDLFGRGGKRGSRGTGEAEVYFGNQVFYVV